VRDKIISVVMIPVSMLRARSFVNTLFRNDQARRAIPIPRRIKNRKSFGLGIVR
jgi:hypothetical protein